MRSAIILLACLAVAGCKIDRTVDYPAQPDSSQVAAKVAQVMAENDITLPQVASYLNTYGFDVISRAEFKRWTWTPPTTGSPVAYYVVNFRVATGNAALPIYLPQGSYASPYVIRVVGVDSQSRTGPWSESNQSAPGALLPGVAP